MHAFERSGPSESRSLKDHIQDQRHEPSACVMNGATEPTPAVSRKRGLPFKVRAMKETVSISHRSLVLTRITVGLAYLTRTTDQLAPHPEDVSSTSYEGVSRR